MGPTWLDKRERERDVMIHVETMIKVLVERGPTLAYLNDSIVNYPSSATFYHQWASKGSLHLYKTFN